jgi:hypothetical protein
MLKFQIEPAHEAKPSGAASQLHEQSGKDQRQLSAVHQPSVYSNACSTFRGNQNVFVLHVI